MLEVRLEGQTGDPVRLEVSPFVIGREADCDLVVDDPRASRRHAQLEVQPDGRVVLRDLDSANGTFVDDRRIEGGVWFTVPGSFRVGRTGLEVRRTSDAAATVIGAAPSDETVVLGRPLVAAAAVAAATPAPVPAVPYATPAQGPAASAPVAVAAAAGAPAVLWAPVSAASDAAPARFRPSRTRALVTMAAIAVAGVVDVASIVHLAGFGELADGISSGAAGIREADAYDVLTTSIGGSALVILVLAGLAYVAWLSRAVENAPALGAGTPPHSPRGAIGWWFVPFASFVVPYQIVTDLHDRLAATATADRARPLLLAWWLTWISSSLLGYGAVFAGDTTIEQLKTANSISMLSDVLHLVAAVLAILVIRRIVGREDARATATRGDESGAPGV